MPSLPVYYMEQGDFLGMLSWFFNNYLPYGIMWIAIGMVIFVIVHGKTKDLAISGAILIMFIGSAGVGNMVPVESRLYFYAFLGVIMSVLVLRLLKSKSVNTT